MSDVSLLLDQYQFNEKPNSDGKILELGGRSSGILAFVLQQLKLSGRSYVTITATEVTFKIVNLSGITYIVCPLDSVRASLAGVSKPLWQLVVGIATVLLGVWSLFTGGGLNGVLIGAIGAGLVYSYFQTNELVLLFSTGNLGDARGLGFYAGTVNGVRVDEEEVIKVARWINNYIEKAHNK